MINQIWLTTFLSELMRVLTKQTLWYVQQDRVVSENRSLCPMLCQWVMDIIRIITSKVLWNYWL